MNENGEQSEKGEASPEKDSSQEKESSDKKKLDNMSSTSTEERKRTATTVAQETPMPKKRGRPKGSKNKRKNDGLPPARPKKDKKKASAKQLQEKAESKSKKERSVFSFSESDGEKVEKVSKKKTKTAQNKGRKAKEHEKVEDGNSSTDNGLTDEETKDVDKSSHKDKHKDNKLKSSQVRKGSKKVLGSVVSKLKKKSAKPRGHKKLPAASKGRRTKKQNSDASDSEEENEDKKRSRTRISRIAKIRSDESDTSDNEDIKKALLNSVAHLKGEITDDEQSDDDEDWEAVKGKRRNKRGELDVHMEMRDMVAKKRMALLNASAIMAASYSNESRRRNPTANTSSSAESEVTNVDIKRKISVKSTNRSSTTRSVITVEETTKKVKKAQGSRETEVEEHIIVKKKVKRQSGLDTDREEDSHGTDHLEMDPDILTKSPGDPERIVVESTLTYVTTQSPSAPQTVTISGESTYCISSSDGKTTTMVKEVKRKSTTTGCSTSSAPPTAYIPPTHHVQPQPPQKPANYTPLEALSVMQPVMRQHNQAGTSPAGSVMTAHTHPSHSSPGYIPPSHTVTPPQSAPTPHHSPKHMGSPNHISSGLKSPTGGPGINPPPGSPRSAPSVGQAERHHSAFTAPTPSAHAPAASAPTGYQPVSGPMPVKANYTATTSAGTGPYKAPKGSPVAAAPPYSSPPRLTSPPPPNKPPPYQHNAEPYPPPYQGSVRCPGCRILIPTSSSGWCALFTGELHLLYLVRAQPTTPGSPPGTSFASPATTHIKCPSPSCICHISLHGTHTGLHVSFPGYDC
ncbi:hypothetical protein C7M84_013118 [Penaeus vannamei]|uniref:Uncharacterized protein n=1 Tax=Penaeus vannamei TaxID=6689 RepID=A0A423SWY7_PENVA|nr:hypothetical protein C7M84_013118 [Penaeus vannamei]